jgi:asparaginyl-tRNA synthetase
MKRIKIVDLLSRETPESSIMVKGWIRSRRTSKNVTFLVLNDGSCLSGIQVLLEPVIEKYESLSRIPEGSSIAVVGALVQSPAKGQKWEVRAEKVEIIGESPEDYPLQKKYQSFEFLRTLGHLRPRTNSFGAVFRIRNAAAYAIHDFFFKRGFVYVHTPIITGSDCEGAGEMFKVTTFDLLNVPRREDGTIDFSQDFFGRETNLTVSGQLEAEIFALSLGDVYTFGPTFRAENSNTSRHASEFWMIEPEMAFYDLQDNIELARDFLKYMTAFVMDHCRADLEFLNERIEKDLIARLDQVVQADFAIMTYDEAIERLSRSGEKFEFPVSWGVDLQSEHERYLTEQVIKGPMFLINYPRQIKAFYMRVNDDDRTVAAMDLLVPKIGEIIGGSQREERHDVLLRRIREMNLNEKDYWWYLELRKYGTVPHAGFGLGFERALMFLTGMANIRDVTPFPRTPGTAEF